MTPLIFNLKPVPWDYRLGFGFKFEFALATLPHNFTDPQPEPRFYRTIHSIDITLNASNVNPYALSTTERHLNMRLHIVHTLTQIGFRVISEIQHQRDIAAFKAGILKEEPEIVDVSWVVEQEPSIQFPTGQAHLYNFYPIEICTPALMYSPWNVELVHNFCRKWHNTYHMNRNESCGLHIYVSLTNKSGIWKL